MEPKKTEARNRVEIRAENDTRIVVMVGEFDMETSSELRTALDPEAPGVSRFVLDISAVTFADSTALSIMLQPALNRPVVLAGEVQPRMARLLQITGCDRAFAAAPSVTDAMAMALPVRRGELRDGDL